MLKLTDIFLNEAKKPLRYRPALKIGNSICKASKRGLTHWEILYFMWKNGTLFSVLEQLPIYRRNKNEFNKRWTEDYFDFVDETGWVDNCGKWYSIDDIQNIYNLDDSEDLRKKYPKLFESVN